MRFSYWLCAFGGAAMLTIVGTLLGASASFSFRHPQAPHLKFVTSFDGRIRIEKSEDAADIDRATGTTDTQSATASAEGAAAAATPEVLIEKTEHDFGVMNPLAMGEHVFVIRNVGSAPLRLRKGDTTCKCTLAKLPSGAVAPGESAEVRLQWNTGRDPNYSHAATIWTDDPRQPRIDLHVHGLVQVICDAIPSAVRFPDQDPECSAEATVELYSRTWERFEIESGESTLMGLTWTAEPLSETRCEQLSATSGYKLTVTAPGDLPKGDFQTRLHLRLVPQGDSEWNEPKVFELELAGRMNSRMSVFGVSSHNDANVVQLGTARPGQALHRRMAIRVRDNELPQAEDFTIHTEPVHLEATIRAKEGASSVRGLYVLDLRVPSDAPPGAYTGLTQGRVRISARHPRLEPIDMPVEFAVLGPQ